MSNATPAELKPEELPTKEDNARDGLWCAALVSCTNMETIHAVVSKAIELRKNPEAREYLNVPESVYALFPSPSVTRLVEAARKYYAIIQQKHYGHMPDDVMAAHDELASALAAIEGKG